MSDALVSIHNLTKSFSRDFPPALDQLTATIPHGEIVGLVGPDGAGKTTLIRLMAALLHPSEGAIEVDGRETTSDAESIHTVTGYMPQKFGLYEDLSVIQNLNLYADLRGVVGGEKKAVFEKLLSFTGLEPFQKRLSRDLSGGMKQKLGLACALVKKPRLLLLDEPSVGVDPISRRELWKMVYELVDEGISVVWSTAYLDEAEKCKTILLLNEGKLLYHGSPKKLTEQVKERVFLIKGEEKKRRKVLMDVLLQKNVLDGVIQGRDIRVVVKEPPFQAENLQIEATPPRFEDAFINILGGGPGGGSELADNRVAVQEDKESVVEAEGLTKRFGMFTAASQISFSVQRGEVFGLLGPNGAGKSTTFKMLCGLLRPTEGKAMINGYNLQKAPSQARAQLGYMAQKFSLYANLTVLQNLEFFSGIYNLQGKKQKEMIEEMIEVFALSKYLSTSTEQLPLGFKQRLSLACATMHSPPLLFLDEPTSGVDPLTRREFWNHINGLVDKGVTVMVTTHFMDEAEYCDRIALIYRGKMINLDAPDALKQSCQTAENPNPTLEEAFIHLIEEYDARTQ
ncbi:MAG: putative multidrug ABC transporter ATP-binding protein YbhF [Chlamydiales bacterium]|nr:putative multidrug ABC transporter ATP-binding protein YbhF [Chlamydiales bacterium]